MSLFCLGGPWILDDVAAAEAAAKTESASGGPTANDTWYDQSHNAVVEQLDASAAWFDSFFGERNDFANDAPRASLNVILDGFYSGVEGESEFDVRFRGSIHLPRLNKKIRLIVDSDSDEQITGYRPEGPQDANQRQRDAGGSLGLEYVEDERDNHRFSFGGGLSGGIPPDVYVNGRYRYTQELGPQSAMRLTETLYWKSDDGFGVASLANFDHFPDTDTLWSLSLYGEYGEETNGFEWSTRASWQKRLNKKTAIGVHTGIQGETDPKELINEGWLTFRYRRNFFRDWLFYEVEPGLSWHHKEDYDTEPTLALRLEMQFHRD